MVILYAPGIGVKKRSGLVSFAVEGSCRKSCRSTRLTAWVRKHCPPSEIAVRLKNHAQQHDERPSKDIEWWHSAGSPQITGGSKSGMVRRALSWLSCRCEHVLADRGMHTEISIGDLRDAEVGGQRDDAQHLVLREIVCLHDESTRLAEGVAQRQIDGGFLVYVRLRVTAQVFEIVRMAEALYHPAVRGFDEWRVKTA